MSANIFHIWLTVAGFEKLAGVIRNEKRRSILNYLPDSLHLVAKVKVSIFFCETRQVTVLRVCFTPRRNCTLQPFFDFIAFSESAHTNRIFLRTAFWLLDSCGRGLSLLIIYKYTIAGFSISCVPGITRACVWTRVILANGIGVTGMGTSGTFIQV